MGAASNYQAFIFHILENSDSRTAKMIKEARRHAKEMSHISGRAPENWGE
jgi:hypothetical protein